MTCQSCHHKIPPVVFRMGRAHLVCIKCGRDVTLELILLHDVEINPDIEVRLPGDYMPARSE